MPTGSIGSLQLNPGYVSAGRLDVLTALADAGADIDAGSDSGSTPLRSACFMTHTAVARFLVERGADVKRPNHNGGTCLVNSVQSTELCRLLIDAGADVDALVTFSLRPTDPPAGRTPSARDKPSRLPRRTCS